jgi:hypothetical protein
MSQQDDDLIYRKDLSEDRIQELQRAAKAHRYTQNCVTAALVGMGIAIFIALLLKISFGILYILVGSLGAGAGYAFYAWGKYLEEKHTDNNPES